MHLLKIRVRTGARTNLVNLISLVGSFMALPSDRFPIERFDGQVQCQWKKGRNQIVQSFPPKVSADIGCLPACSTDMIKWHSGPPVSKMSNLSLSK